MTEANTLAHWDLSNKANANRFALVFIYIDTIIYVCFNGGGCQLFSSAAHNAYCIIDEIWMSNTAASWTALWGSVCVN